MEKKLPEDDLRQCFKREAVAWAKKKTVPLKSNDTKSDNWVRDLDSFMTLAIEYGWTTHNDGR